MCKHSDSEAEQIVCEEGGEEKWSARGRVHGRIDTATTRRSQGCSSTPPLCPMGGSEVVSMVAAAEAETVCNVTETVTLRSGDMIWRYGTLVPKERG